MDDEKIYQYDFVSCPLPTGTKVKIYDWMDNYNARNPTDRINTLSELVKRSIRLFTEIEI